jgi:hypothetical protein
MYTILGAESRSGGETQQPVSVANQKTPPKNPASIPHQKTSMSSFSKSFISSGKQRGGATVLWEGCDIVTRETCIPTSLYVNNLGKATELDSASLSSMAGAVPNSSYRSLSTTVLVSSSHRLLIICSPHQATVIPYR